ncbi:MAG TPA: exonuclease domain-containing protein [Candidatus Paceibacterota bacterium]|nr:exonuclease domain-containing protein [Candidatus Paceibacterota bacterium]
MIVLDVESSGVVPERHSIVSIGAIDLEDTSNQFYEECQVWEGAEISDEALVVNGFSKEEITGRGSFKQTEAELVASFIAWAMDRPADTTLAAQNVTFDRLFLEAACRRAKIEFPFAHRTLDVHSLVWMHMISRGLTPPVTNKHSGINLGFALTYAGVPEEPKPHNALTGALCHAEVIARIAYNKKLLSDFSTFDIPWETNR